MSQLSSQSRVSPARRRLAAAAFVAIAVAGSEPALAGAEGPYPIWWSSALGLDSLEDIDRRLERPLWNNLQGGIALYTIVGYVKVSAVADTCRALDKLTAEGYEADSRNGKVIVEAHLHHCRAIELLRHAKPARVSFVQNFAMDRHAVDVLPDYLVESSCEYICEQVGSTDKGISWSDNERISAVDQVDETTIKVLEIDDPNKPRLWAYLDLDGNGVKEPIWSGAAQNVDGTSTNFPVIRTTAKARLVARADFNDDGVEDLLIVVSRWRSDYGWFSTDRFLLSRRSPYDAVLGVSGYEGKDCAASTCWPASAAGSGGD